MTVCPNCGQNADTKYCPECGAPLKEKTSPTGENSQGDEFLHNDAGFCTANTESEIGTHQEVTRQADENAAQLIQQYTRGAEAPGAPSVVINNVINAQSTSATSSESVSASAPSFFNKKGSAFKILAILLAVAVLGSAIWIVFAMSKREEIVAASSSLSVAATASPQETAFPAGMATISSAVAISTAARPFSAPSALAGAAGITGVAGGDGIITEYELFLTEGHRIAVKIANTTNQELGRIAVSVTYMKDGAMLATAEESYPAVAAGRILIYEFSKPTDKHHKLVDFDDVDITINTQETSIIFDVGNQVEVTHNLGAKGVLVRAVNRSEEEIGMLVCMVLYFRDGEVVNVSRGNDYISFVVKAGAVVTMGGMEYFIDDIEFDSYEVYLATAYVWP